jgi:hypothetical protein
VEKTALGAPASFGLSHFPDVAALAKGTKCPQRVDWCLVSVSFGTGEGGSHTGFIEKVDGVFDGGGTVYTISYKEDGVENQFSFYYSEQKGKTIVFRNQPNVVWSKVNEL